MSDTDPFIGELDAEEARGADIPVLTPNLSQFETARCDICGDEGWVELEGGASWFGVHYEHGCAPCNLCEIGERIAKCLRTGTNTHFGASVKPKEEPWRAIPDIRTRYALNDVRFHAPDYAKRSITLDQYAETEQGKADKHLGALLAVLAERRQARRRMRREETPRPLVPAHPSAGRGEGRSEPRGAASGQAARPGAFARAASAGGNRS